MDAAPPATKKAPRKFDEFPRGTWGSDAMYKAFAEFADAVFNEELNHVSTYHSFGDAEIRCLPEGAEPVSLLWQLARGMGSEAGICDVRVAHLSTTDEDNEWLNGMADVIYGADANANEMLENLARVAKFLPSNRTYNLCFFGREAQQTRQGHQHCTFPGFSPRLVKNDRHFVIEFCRREAKMLIDL